MLKSVSELIRGGGDGAHPPESIGTTSRTQSTRASKVNELRMRGEEEEEDEEERERDRKLRMQVWLRTTHNLPTRTTQRERIHLGEIQLPVVWPAADEEMLWFDPCTASSSSSSSSSPARNIPHTDCNFFSLPYPDGQTDRRTDTSQARCVHLPDMGQPWDL